MMKKITLLIILLTVSFGYAQNSPITFDVGVTVGVNWNNATGIATSIVDVNDASIPGTINAPANPAGMVGKMITNAGSDPWQEAHLEMTTSSVDLTQANKTIIVDVYSTTGNDFLLKVIDPIGGGASFSQVPAAHDGTGWEQLEFNFNNATGGGIPNALFKTLVFFPLYNAVAVDFIPAAMTTTAIDNVVFIEGSLDEPESCTDGIQNQDETGIDCGGTTCPSCPVPPNVAPTTPPARAGADVISIYGEAYGTAVGLANVGWDPADFAEVSIAANNVLKIDVSSAGTFMGSALSTVTNANDMTYFHMDYWIADFYVAGQVFNPKWSNHTGGTGQTDSFEYTRPINSSADVQTWKSIDVPLTAFTEGLAGGGVSAREALTEFLITFGNDLNLAYIDNVYLHKNTTLGTDEFEISGLNVYPNPSKNVWNVKTNNQTLNSIQVFDILGKQVLTLNPKANNAVIDATNLSNGLYFAKVNTDKGSSTLKLIKN